MNKALLREYIKLLINEDVGDPDTTTLALIKSNNGEGVTAIILRYDLLYKELYSSTDDVKNNLEAYLYDIIEKAVVGYGQFGPVRGGGKAHGAWEVYKTAGPGFGKIIYNIGYALSPKGLLVPDRKSVSSRASNFWSKEFHEKQKLELDALPPHNLTSGDDDDAILHKYRDEQHLNYAYKATGREKPMVNRMLRMGSSLIKEIVDKFSDRLDEDKVINIISMVGKQFFSNVYAEYCM